MVGPRHGRAPVDLPDPFARVLYTYIAALTAAALFAAQTRRTYASKARQFLAWLAAADVDRDPLGSADGRDWPPTSLNWRRMSQRAARSRG